VVCLFCGIETEIFHGADHRGPEHEAAALIVRCEHCGKESRYLASEISDFPKLVGKGIPRSRTAGAIG
jgi:hypothetical protein